MNAIEWQEWEQAADDYAAAMELAQANGTYATQWKHANCDHANNYCQGA